MSFAGRIRLIGKDKTIGAHDETAALAAHRRFWHRQITPPCLVLVFAGLLAVLENEIKAARVFFIVFKRHFFTRFNDHDGGRDFLKHGHEPFIDLAQQPQSGLIVLGGACV